MHAFLYFFQHLLCTFLFVKVRSAVLFSSIYRTILFPVLGANKIYASSRITRVPLHSDILGILFGKTFALEETRRQPASSSDKWLEERLADGEIKEKKSGLKSLSAVRTVA